MSYYTLYSQVLAGSCMDFDQVLQKIGGFGWAQKKIVYTIIFIHIITGFHLFAYTFIGEDPGWSCPGTEGEHGSADLCREVGEGTCTPEFSKNFTSIVTEVIDYTWFTLGRVGMYLFRTHSGT